MNAKRNFLIGLILGGLIGWALGFLRLPIIEKNFSFLIGFIACLAFIALLSTMAFIWKKNALLIRLFGKKQGMENPGNAASTYAYIWLLVSVFIALGGSVSSVLIFKQNELFKAQTRDLDKRIGQQSVLIESIRKSNLGALMSNILDKVDDELKNNRKGILSDETIERIAALSYSFKPYPYWEGDSLSEKKFSPERGQLLLALSVMEIDSSSFDKIKRKTPFSGADLSGANLHGADLSGADLSGANLKEADLRRVNFKEADLRKANLWAANMNGANLGGADLTRANLGWAELNGADLNGADLDGIDLTSAKLRKADLSGTSLKWAYLNDAFLNEANLAGVDMVGTEMRRANLSGANFGGASLVHVNLSGANLTHLDLIEADLTNTLVEEKHWLEKLTEWQVKGAKEIQLKYKIIDGKPYKSNYRLEKLKN